MSHFRHQRRRQPFGRLVHDQQVGIRHQRPRDRQHLLLAAAQLVAAIVPPLGEPREHREDLLEIPAVAALGARDRAAARRAGAAIARFSCTVSDGKMRRPCGTRLMPQVEESGAAAGG